MGKPQLVLKNAPLGDHSPAVAHNPLNGATFLFYHANPVDLERMGMDRPKGGDAPKESRRSRHAEDEGEVHQQVDGQWQYHPDGEWLPDV